MNCVGKCTFSRSIINYDNINAWWYIPQTERIRIIISGHATLTLEEMKILFWQNSCNCKVLVLLFSVGVRRKENYWRNDHVYWTKRDIHTDKEYSLGHTQIDHRERDAPTTIKCNILYLQNFSKILFIIFFSYGRCCTRMCDINKNWIDMAGLKTLRQ